MNLQVTSLFIIAIINSILSLFVLLGKRDRTNIVYSVFVLFASLWAIGLAFFLLELNVTTALYLANFYYVSALGIPLFFLYFSYIFLNKDLKVAKSIKTIIPLSFISLITLLILDNHLLLLKINITGNGKDVVINKINYVIYSIYFVFFVGLSYYNLIKSYIQKNIPEEKSQLKLIILGTAIGFFFGMVFNLFLPFLGNYKLIFLGPIFSLFMVGSIAYSITKYRLFDMKVVVTETFVTILCVFMFIRILVSETTQDQIINTLSFIITVTVGIFIVQSVRKEVQLRERIENLAKDLEKANQSLESANDRLKELDQLKSEFLSLATHQIRAPLTAIKGYASMIMEGDFGKTSEKVNGAVKTIFQSCQNLVVIVNEFLDISRIEQGRMKYDCTDFDIKKLCTDIINELRPNVENAHLTIDFSADEKETYTVHADIGKVKQVIGNIIDNAIKYTPQGGITISLEKIEKKTRIRIKDTGIGIEPADIPKLFGKFVRAKDANKTNVIGTGLGLYVSKQMIEAQGGKVWVESEGLGKGSSFMIEL